MDSNFEKSAGEIKTALAQAGLQLKAESPLPYGVQFLVSDNTVHQASVSVYHGKRGITAVIGGKDSPLRRKLEDIVSRVQAAAPKANEFSARPKPSIVAGFEDQPDFNGECVGTDESGKGDFFGPLVVAGVLLDTLNAEKLVAGGVKDSKAVPDAQVAPLADLIRSLGREKFYELELVPLRYNSLYAQLRQEGKSLNHLLAWAHARVLENLACQSECRFAIADQFADKQYLESRLMQAGRKIKLVQTPKAERNISVAAASILARDRFLRRLAQLSAQYGMVFPKGAGERVREAGREFIARYGEARLAEVAKTHFRTAGEL